MRNSLYVIFIVVLHLFMMQYNAFSQKAVFSADYTSGCSPLIITFNAGLSEGTGLTYTWDFGNGNSTSGPDKVLPAATYFTSGVYTVTLTVTNSNGKHIETKNNYITVFPKPETNFQTSDNILGCLPHSMQFTNKTPEGNAPVKSWIWSFGDGEGSSEQNPEHVFKSAGNFDISLLTEDANGCKNSFSKKDAVHIREPLEMNFTTSPKNQTFCKVPVVPSFNSIVKNTTGYPTQYLWDFGDGTNSNLANPQHEYNVSGNFPVTLNVKNDIPGCEVSKKINSLINIANYTTDFTAIKTGCLPLVVNFTNTSNIQNGVQFNWDFGDGTTGNEINPYHTYNTPGTFTVKLEMKFLDISCSSPPAIKNNFITVTSSGTIDFKASQQSSCTLPMTVNFTDLSDHGISWLWQFGDGIVSNVRNPTHIYDSKGVRNVVLTVTEASGCVKTLTKNNFINLSDASADFTASSFNGCTPFTTQFQNTSAVPDNITSYAWDFGDGTFSSDQSPLHTYFKTGSFKAMLTITTSSGCKSSSHFKIFNAGNKPHAEFTTFPPQEGCKPLSQLFNTSLSHSFDSLWLQPEVTTAGGKESSISFKPGVNNSHYYSYSTPGTFSPHIIGFNSGCTDTFLLKDVITVLPPQAKFTFSVPACNAGAVSFKDESAGATRVLWNFGTGSHHDSSTLRNPIFNYSSPGTYTVTLKAYYDNGTKHCDDFTTSQIYIPNYSSGNINFSVTKDQGCAPLDVILNPEIHYADPSIKVNSYQWILGDGGILSDKVANHKYNAGVYDIKLIVESSRGCKDTLLKKQLIKSSKPKADFNSPTSGCYPFVLKSSDKSSGIFPIQKRSWRLGKENISTHNDTSVQYNYKTKPTPLEQNNGTVLSLKIVDDLGCIDSVAKKINITIPLVSYKKEIIPNCLGDTIVFKKSMSNDTSGAAPFTFNWHFKDTTVIGDSIKQFFAKGNSNSYLKVIDKFGCSDSVNILSDVALSTPKANFGANPKIITCWPGQIIFKDSTKIGKAGIKNYKWDFGDTTALSVVKNPSHIYNNSGKYDIKLIVVDSIGCIDTIIKKDYITIRGPIGTFDEDTTLGYAPLKVNFVTISENVAKFIWDYGDGTLGTAESSDHIYERAGNYIPKLIVEDDLGCKNIFQKDTIKVMPCAPYMQKIDTSICFGNSVKLKAGYSLGTHEWQGRSDTSDFISTDTAGLYIVKIAIPGLPCFAFDSFNIKLIDLRFDLGVDTTICYGQVMSLNTEKFSDNLFHWSNGKTDSSIMVNESGNYRVKISDRDSLCFYEDSIKIRILPIVKADAGPDLQVCKGERTKLTGKGGTIFRWTPNKINVPSYSFVPPRSITYYLTVTDSLRCSESKDTVNVIVHNLPLPVLPDSKIFCFEDSAYSFTVGSKMHFKWNSGKDSSNVFKVTEGGKYKVILFNQWGCKVEEEIELTAICPPKVFPPQAFTPNGDGINDHYKVFGEHFKNYELVIFNRWGEIVFKSISMDETWDGKFEGQEMQEGVYPFAIVYESLYPHEEGKIYRKKGSIILKK